MSVPGLFVPTYGKKETAGQASAAKQKASSRVLPPKPTAPQPKTKQSGPGLPSLVFNGNIEYIQVYFLWPFSDENTTSLVVVLGRHVGGSRDLAVEAFQF